MGKKILVVVDYQYDFANPNGALYVNGGEKLHDNIMKIIPNFDGVIFTQDWHPLEHCSFKENGGIWPVHCVANTIGAGIPVELFKVSKDYVIYDKGTLESAEEYGAFDTSKDNFTFSETYGSMFYDEPYENSCLDSVVVCGIAGDYCVVETLKNIVKEVGPEKVRVYLDGIVSIDGGTALNTYISENNIAVYIHG